MSDPDRYADYEKSLRPDDQLFVDLLRVLTICAKHELLFVTHLIDATPDSHHEIELPSILPQRSQNFAS